MDGPSFVALVEKELKSRGIAKAEFYSATGISSATFSQWRNGLYAPSSTNIKKVEAFLGIRFDFSILLDAARDAAAKKAPAADTGDERKARLMYLLDQLPENVLARELAYLEQQVKLHTEQGGPDT